MMGHAENGIEKQREFKSELHALGLIVQSGCLESEYQRETRFVSVYNDTNLTKTSAGQSQTLLESREIKTT